MSYQRARFEKHMTGQGYPKFMLERGQSGHYLDTAVQADWELWDMATSQSDPDEIFVTGPVDQN